MKRFIEDETGAITVDWVALSAMLILLGMVVLFAIYHNGGTVVLEIINAFSDDYKTTAENLPENIIKAN